MGDVHLFKEPAVFSFRKPSSLDAAGKLEACRAHLAAAEDELAARRGKYEHAILRSAGDADVRTETAESKRMHGFYCDQRAVVERAQDAVAAAERLHAEAQAREQSAADAAQWAHVEAMAAARTAAAEAVERHAAALAEAIEKFSQRNSAVHAALPHNVRSRVDFESVIHWRELVVRELTRTGVTRDALGGKPPYPPPPSITERARGLESIVRKHRPAAAEVESQADAA